MRTAVRWLFRGLFVLAACVSVWWAVHQFVLPRLVHDRLLAAMQRLGLDGSAVRIERLGADRAVLSNLIIGSQDLLTIESAEITYDLTDAARGRFKTIQLTGAWLRLAFRDGRIDLGQLGEIDTGSGDDGGKLRFDRIALRSSVVHIDLPEAGTGLYLPVSGDIVRRDDGSLDFDKITVDLIDRQLVVSGVLTPTAGGARFDDARVYLSPGDIPIASQGVTLRGASFVLRLAATWADGVVTAKLDEGSRIDAAGVALRVLPHASLPFISTGGSSADGEVRSRTRIAARFESVAPLRYQTDALDASVDRLAGDVVVHFGAGAPLAANGSLVLEGGAASIPASDVAFTGVRATIPITHHAKPTEQGVFTVNGIRVGDDTLPAIVGAARVQDGRLVAAADWKLADGVVADLTADASPGAGALRLRLPPTFITDPLALGRVFAALRPVDVTGRIALDASVGWREGKLDPLITLELAEVDVASADLDLSVSGIDATVTIDALDPLSTSSNQRVTADAVRLGKLQLTDAFATGRLESAGALFVEQAQWTLGSSGRFFVHALRLDRDAPAVSTNVFIEDLNAGDWLSLLTGEPVTATGAIYGRIPVAIDPEANRVLRLGKGYLHAQSGGGTLRFQDEQTVARLLQSTDARFAPGGSEAAVRQDLAEALSDFAYDKFRLDLVSRPGSDELGLSIQISGQGLKGKKAPVKALNINISDFELAANIALFTQTGLTRRIDRSLDGALPGVGASAGGSQATPTDADFERFFE